MAVMNMDIAIMSAAARMILVRMIAMIPAMIGKMVVDAIAIAIVMIWIVVAMTMIVAVMMIATMNVFVKSSVIALVRMILAALAAMMLHRMSLQEIVMKMRRIQILTGMSSRRAIHAVNVVVKARKIANVAVN